MKYYKAEDVQELIDACMWRMTLAKERGGEGFVEYDKHILDVDELRKRLSTLSTIEVSEDYISRKWLETNFQTVCENVICSECPFDDDDCRLIKFIVDAPSVVPSRAEGEWIISADGESSCSVCGASEEEFICGTENWYGLGESKFCPSCGAKMKGADDETN